MLLTKLRKNYHLELSRQVIRVGDEGTGYPNFADGSNRSSVEIANKIIERLGDPPIKGNLASQTLGDKFETITKEFISSAFELLQHIRPGEWLYSTNLEISRFEQYEHLAELDKLIKEYPELKSTLGSDYIIKPDIVVGRHPVEDAEINRHGKVVESNDLLATHTPLRKGVNKDRVLLHASISCKWTIRSDRTQNIRTESQNLIRNRKGNLPHVVAVTAEPLPSRIAALAYGTGDLDSVYHFALPELEYAVATLDKQDQNEILADLIKGKRLRDISDLPFDLAI